MADFVHLHLHTLYSLLDGAIRMKDLMKTVLEKGMSSVAVTDHGNMFGAIDFYRKAKDAGVKPILGMEAYVAGPKGRKDRTERTGQHLVLLAENEEGYRNLRYLSSMAYLEGHYYHPRIDKELLRGRSRGLFGLTACLGGEIPSLLKTGDRDGARRAALEYRDIFEPGHFFLEIQSNGLVEQERVNADLKQLARDLDLPLVATADAHYVKREDAKAHEILMAIAQGKALDDPKRMRHETDQLYIKSPEEMAACFSDVPEAVENTARIAAACNVELKFGKLYLPKFQVPDGFDNDSYLEHLARTGLEKRIKELPYPVDRDAYHARLEMELSVIKKMGFSGYFLIVQDFINWAKGHGCPVGPGRGSGAGSLVAYSIRITDLDPIPYALLFERFLNPERVSMPDFDVDFCQTNRYKVIDYVTKKYGETNVGQIATFGQLSAKSAIKDVGKVLGLAYGETNELTKGIPNLIDGHPPTVAKALEAEPKLKQRVESDPRVAEVVGIAQKLEGLNRQTGMHAAGIVIADQPLWEYVPVFQPPGENFLVTQFAKEEVEKAGLVKFDFLGLKTLTVIADAIRMVNENHPDDPPLTAERIPIDDPDTYRMIARGDCKGIFQLESSGFIELCKKLKPDRFEDIVAAVALYRPGPLQTGMVDDFVERKHGRQKVSYPHPLLEKILEPTYGVIVYQEQVMQISQAMGGYSLGRADLLRRAMGKKKPEEMAKERVGFLAGAKAKGIDDRTAGEVFDLMEKFAGYGFNKSHSAAYALITMQTAWLKCHHRAEFMAALLTSDADKTDKLVEHVADVRSDGIEVRGPDVNESHQGFHGANGKILFGLGGVKGVGGTAVEAILEARKDGPFLGLFDFAERVDQRRVNKKVTECLVKAGAFDFTGLPRSRLYASVEPAFERGAAAQRDRQSGQESLFGLLAPKAAPGAGKPGSDGDYAQAEPWTDKEKLTGEKETIGFYLTGHPLGPYAEEIRRLATHSIARIHAEARPRDKVKVVGVVAALRTRPSAKTGKLMGFVTLEDVSGSIEAICFPGGRRANPRDGTPAREGGFEVWQPLLETDQPLLVTATVQQNGRGDEENPTLELIVDEVVSLAEARAARATRLVLQLAHRAATAELLQKARGLLAAHPGTLPVELRLLEPGKTLTRLALREFRVTPSDELTERLGLLLGEGAVAVE
jgi:DNA polymerase-3 subunit alpha